MAAPDTSSPPSRAPAPAGAAGSFRPGQTSRVAKNDSRGDQAARQQEAGQRYDRAFKLYDEGAYAAARSELERAYQLVPAFRILYNLGVMSLAVHDHAGAIQYFERYLAEGADAIAPQVQGQITEALQDLGQRVAKVSIRTNVPGAVVSVDEQVVGTAPLAPVLRLNAGSHRISAQATGWLADSRVVSLAGGDNIEIDLALIDQRTPAPSHIEKPTSQIPWMGWGATALLAGGSALAGIEALAAQREFERKRRELGVSPGDLESADAKAFRWSVATDVLAVGGLAALGYSLYFTLYPPASKSTEERSSRTRVDLVASGFRVSGQF